MKRWFLNPEGECSNAYDLFEQMVKWNERGQRNKGAFLLLTPHEVRLLVQHDRDRDAELNRIHMELRDALPASPVVDLASGAPQGGKE